ncbi:MAG: DUF58 domain-containing protein [Deltaproteobacteria bacterium]|nr:MAG: DUF58 domain-containing protein [Deltaproteobacteria bacterium]
MAQASQTRPRLPRLPRTLKVTREGRWYLGLTFAVGLAAVNTGNNLLFLSLGMLLALIVLSGLLSEAALRRLSVERVLPRELRAEEAARLGVVVHNGNRYLPAMALSVSELAPQNARVEPGRILVLPAGKSARAVLRLVPHRRGTVRLCAVQVTTAYPFGIFAKTRTFPLDAELLAWPARVPPGPLPDGTGRPAGALVHTERGGQEDLRGLRPFRDGDDARHVHWRRSVRVGAILVVERDRPRGRQVLLHLPAGRGEAFEDAVKRAAAQVEACLARGDEVGLEGALTVPIGGGPAHRRRMLTALARVPPAARRRAGT